MKTQDILIIAAGLAAGYYVGKKKEDASVGKFSITKKDYEEWLNELGEDMSVNWIIGGKDRSASGSYGTAMRKYDPIGFQAGFNDFVMEEGYRRDKFGLKKVSGMTCNAQYAL